MLSPLTHLSDRYGRRTPLATGLAFVAGGLLVLAAGAGAAAPGVAGFGFRVWGAFSPAPGPAGGGRGGGGGERGPLFGPGPGRCSGPPPRFCWGPHREKATPPAPREAARP